VQRQRATGKRSRMPVRHSTAKIDQNDTALAIALEMAGRQIIVNTADVEQTGHGPGIPRMIARSVPAAD
jgi:hypothetical protein